MNVFAEFANRSFRRDDFEDYLMAVHCNVLVAFVEKWTIH